jgi:glycerol uptake facilitator-like aquaporin
MKNYLTEAIGTFVLVFTVGLCVNERVAMAPLAIGSALTGKVIFSFALSYLVLNTATSNKRTAGGTIND